MEWFKHMTGSHDDPDLSDAWDKFGDAGIVIFWVILEIYGSEFNSLSDDGVLNVSIRFLERKLRRRWSAVAPKLGWFQSRGRIYFEVEEDRVKIRIPKFLKLASNWTRRKKTPTEVPTEAPAESPQAIEEKKNRIEKKRNNKEKKGSDFVLPDWVPKESWDGFVESRKKKKPLTDRAKHLIIKKLIEMRARGHDPGAILDEAVEHGWMSVYEPKQDKAMSGGNGGGYRYAGRNRIPEPVERETAEAIERINRMAREIAQKSSPDKTKTDA